MSPKELEAINARLVGASPTRLSTTLYVTRKRQVNIGICYMWCDGEHHHHRAPTMWKFEIVIMYTGMKLSGDPGKEKNYSLSLRKQAVEDTVFK
jgi:hypothetical protein